MSEDKILPEKESSHDIPTSAGENQPVQPDVKESKQESVQSISESQPLPNESFEQIPLQKPNNENMEVHHHGHVHEKKKWLEYLFQFFMLFLAVFCGFLAEYQLEHRIEKDREKQFMQTFLVDLQRDTAEIIEDSGTWERVINDIDSLRKELEKPEDSQNVALMYKASTTIIFRYTTFRYNDRTIQQLRNSGNFRLIEREISDSMIHYDATA